MRCVAVAKQMLLLMPTLPLLLLPCCWLLLSMLP